MQEPEEKKKEVQSPKVAEQAAPQPQPVFPKGAPVRRLSIIDLLSVATSENKNIHDVLQKETTKGINLLRSPSSKMELQDFSAHPSIEFPEKHRLWYKEAVFYEVYTRAFCDTTGDGMGDLAGITSKLDYLHELGVDCLWLLPIYPSPLFDDGYDIADYTNIHPHYGTLNDFRTLVAAVHERNMRIIVDYVPNHSSVDCEWFKQSRSSRDNPYRDWYVWSDDPTKYSQARIIFVDVEKSNWTWDEQAGQYYWHRFFSAQPDLNFDNPKVREAMLNVMKFWLDIGVDGFRVDAVPFLFEREGTTCESLPETHAFLREMRAFIHKINPDAIILCEACQPPADVRQYFGNDDEFHMGFHFPLMPRIYLSIKREDSTSLRDIMAETPQIPERCQWVTFLRNHDELTLEMVTPEERQYMWREYAPNPRMKLNLGIRRRLAPLLDNDRRRIELAYSMLLTMPGSPILYYGDEIGMGDNIWLEDRNGVRTPMQWEPVGASAGFSPSAKTYAPVINDPVYGKEKVNVRDALKDPSSLFHCIKQLIRLRRQHSAFGLGTFEWLPTQHIEIAAYLRDAGFDKMVVVSNLSSRVINAVVPLSSRCFPLDWQDPPYLMNIITGERVTLDGSNSGAMQLKLTLEPYQFLWLASKPAYLREEDYIIPSTPSK